jgi:hypothetical protein
MSQLAASMTTAAQWVRHRLQALEEANKRNGDRGDISITTVIIWVAVVAGALVIAGTITVVITKYNTKLSGI